MTDNIPTTDEIRDMWVDNCRAWGRLESELVPEYQQRFDAWLEGVLAVERERLRAQVKALESPRTIEVDELGAVVAVPVTGLIWRSAVMELLGGESDG